MKGNVEYEVIYSSCTIFKQILKDHFITLQESSLYRTSNDIVIFDRLNGSVRYDYLLPENWGFLTEDYLKDRWRIFAINTHAYNKFLKLDYRVTGGFGPGYPLYFKKKIETQKDGKTVDTFIDYIENDLSVLFIYNHENFSTGIEDDTFEVSIRNLFTWNIQEGVQIGLDGFYILSMEDGNDYRLYGKAYIQVNVYKKKVFLQLSIEDEYDNRPQEGVKKMILFL